MHSIVPRLFRLLLPALALAGLVRADLYTGEAPFAGSSVDVQVSGGFNGSQTVDVLSGNLGMELTGSGGLYSALRLTGGDFLLDDSNIPITGFFSGNLVTSGFGFSVLDSTLILSPTGNANEYSISGLLNLVADTGMAALQPGGPQQDFGVTPAPVSPTLLGTSLLTIVTLGDSVQVSGALKFDEVTLASYPAVSTSLSVSSANTLNFSGNLTAIPEPSAVAFWLMGLAFLLRLRRHHRT